MSFTSSLCAFCRFIPFNVDTLEKLRTKARSGFRGRGPRPLPLDVGGEAELSPEDKTVFALGNTARVLSSNCPFCKIVATAVREAYRVPKYGSLRPDIPLRVTWSHNGPGSKGVFTINDACDTYLCFVAEQGMGSSTGSFMQRNACIIRPTAYYLEASDILRWIANCKENHGEKCNVDASTTGPIKESYRGLHALRFVDVRKKCIVERTEVVRYVALSYVWGAAATVRLTKINHPQMCRPGVLSGLQLPMTIQDAIELTMVCGEQYLWVDALCIVQDDFDDLDAGTRAMDLIYERSEFTIAAAAGHDASHGLPGVRGVSRLAPSYAEVSPGVRIGVLSEIDTLISRSCYVTRGWTMQEEKLSKRVLYFLDDNLYFHCPCMTMWEGCREPLYWQPLAVGVELDTADPVRGFQRILEAYSDRVLTKDEDAFRAISGILGRISVAQQWQTIAGMPMTALGRMMLFSKHCHVLRRRRGFPSYSWLGWKGAVHFWEDFDIRFGWIFWYVSKPVNDPLSNDYWPAGHGRDFGTILFPAGYDCLSQNEPDFDLLPGIDSGRLGPWNEAWLRSLRPFPLLCFRTLAVFFNLDLVDYIEGTAKIRRPVDLKFYGNYIGKVILDGLDDCPLSELGEFILLNRTRSSYAVLLIEWIDGVAERRGIGTIHHSEIQYSLSPGPIWKDIILG